MKTVRVEYPIEPGFIWLLRQDGLWGGWREGSFSCEHESHLEQVFSKLHKEGGEEVMYEMVFIRLNSQEKHERWKPTVVLPEAHHFDFWNLPERQMHLFESEHLPSVLKMVLREILQAEAALGN